LITYEEDTTMAFVIGDSCISCGTCAGNCPVGAISEGEKYSIDPDACSECGTCASVCPNEAIALPE
jgi:ferredoxin